MTSTLPLALTYADAFHRNHIGFAWAAWWFGWFRDDPPDKQTGRPESRRPAAPGGTPRLQDLISVNSALLVAQYFASNFTFFICFSWLIPYLRSHFGLGPREAGAWASIPLYCGALATWTSGLAVDALHRRDRRQLSRRLPAMCGFGLAAVMLLAAVHTSSAARFVACFAVTTFGVDFTLSPSWSMASDLGGRRTGTLSAAMNTLGSLGSFASSVTFPVLLAWTGSIQAHFLVAAALNAAAVFCWWRMRPCSRETS